MIKKTKRLHQLYQDWLKIKDMKLERHYKMNEELVQLSKNMGLKGKFPDMFSQPMAGKWYYEYRNDEGGYVGLAKLQDHNFMFGRDHRMWMWETCTTNEGLELRRFPTQKAAEVEIYKFLSNPKSKKAKEYTKCEKPTV